MRKMSKQYLYISKNGEYTLTIKAKDKFNADTTFKILLGHNTSIFLEAKPVEEKTTKQKLLELASEIENTAQNENMDTIESLASEIREELEET